MRYINVVAAIIHDNKNQFFATQRGSGEWKDYWEFPGGKIEDGESPENALSREIMEELDAKIVIENLIQIVEWDYPNFHLTMHCYLCHLESGSNLTLKEHEAAKWLSKSELNNVNWLPADKLVIDSLQS